ncbi:MAG: hypothetical protein NVSMB42_11770 [Herpetosiphon sp.]
MGIGGLLLATLLAPLVLPPLVVAATKDDGIPATVQAGYPTLLADRPEERRLRGYLGNSIDRVMSARQRAMDAIYGGDVGRARTALDTYRVDKVVVGPAERARYGAGVGQGLAQLAASSTITTTFDNGDTKVYQIAQPTTAPPFVFVSPQLAVPSPQGMLQDPIERLPRVDDYAWNSVANSHQVLAVLLWLLVIECIGLLTWPLTHRIFGRLDDGGWGWSKIVGLLVWGYVVWLLTSLHLLTYSVVALVVGAALTALLAALVGGWRPRRPGPTDGSIWQVGLRTNRRSIVRSEALFLLAFGVWVVVRGLNPDLWHPTLGGEKPFEFGFLNAILRSPYMPPADPFFSGGTINYYYYGLFLMSLPIKATGIAPGIGFNLAVSTLFALVAVGSATVVQALTGRWRWGLLGTLFVTLLGPVGSVLFPRNEQGPSGIMWLWEKGQAGWQSFGGRIGDWFWGPSRMLDTATSHTISEFPLFSYLFADLHPHMIALPFTLLLVGLGFELFRRLDSPSVTRFSGEQRQAVRVLPFGRDVTTWPLYALASLAMGTLAAANSWDLPTYALLIGGVIMGAAWRRRRADAVVQQRRMGAPGLGTALVEALVLPVVGVALFLPFFLQYHAMVGGAGVVHFTDSLAPFLMFFGLWLFATVSFLAVTGGLLLRQMRSFSQRLVQDGAVAGSILVMIGLSGSVALQQQPHTGIDWILRGMLATLLALALVFVFVVRRGARGWFILWLMVVGLAVELGTQLVFVRDHLDGSPWERMNTVFKFSFQSWTMLALASAAAIPRILRRLKQANPVVAGVWNGLLIVLILGGAVYPLVGLPSRISTRFPNMPRFTLDGLAFLQQATYTADTGNNTSKQIVLADDRAGIDWLNRHVAGLQIVLQSDREFYRSYGMRIAANTGLPTVLGNLHENEQRPAQLVETRHRDVETMLNSPDIAATDDLLTRYGVNYVYVGPAERAFSDPAGVAKWDSMVGHGLKVAFEHGLVKIYRVLPDLQPPTVRGTVPKPVPTVVKDDGRLKSLEAVHEADPASNIAAFGLAQEYARLGRIDDAVNTLQPAVAAHPDDVPIHQFLGDLEAQLGHADAAQTAWEAAAKVAPTMGNWNKLAMGMLPFGRWAVVEQAVQQAQAADPKAADPVYSLAEMYRLRKGNGDRERAIATYEAFIKQTTAGTPYRAQAEQTLRELRK